MSEEFYDAATFGDMDTVRQMLASNPALVHSKIKWDFTALHGVAGEEQFEMAEFLLGAGETRTPRTTRASRRFTWPLTQRWWSFSFVAGQT